jgi:uncharacterized protein
MISADPALASSTDKYKLQPIHLLDVYFDEEILNLLLANGADINAKNDKGIALLHIVTDPDATATLVGKGADLETRDERGWTPLFEQTTMQRFWRMAQIQMPKGTTAKAHSPWLGKEVTLNLWRC